MHENMVRSVQIWGCLRLISEPLCFSSMVVKTNGICPFVYHSAVSSLWFHKTLLSSHIHASPTKIKSRVLSWLGTS